MHLSSVKNSKLFNIKFMFLQENLIQIYQWDKFCVLCFCTYPTADFFFSCVFVHVPGLNLGYLIEIIETLTINHRKIDKRETEKGREEEDSKEAQGIDKFSCFHLLYHRDIQPPQHVPRSCAPCGASACGAFLIGTCHKAFCSLRHQYTKCTASERKSTAIH